MLQDRTWLLIGRKMANEASPQELKELEDILKSNPELHFTMQALSDMWSQSGNCASQDIEAVYNAHISRMREKGLDVPGKEDQSEIPPLFVKSPARRSRMVRLVAVLSAAAAIIILLVAVGPFRPRLSRADIASSSEISTRNGSKTNILLPDGTKVWLNAGSKLTYGKDFSEQRREVMLTGEAYFDVVHDASKPFVIHTRSMDIRVLGTEFNVKSYPDEKTTEASLIRGSIEVTLTDRAAEKIILKPNEKIVVTDEPVEETVTEPRAGKTVPPKPIISVSHLNYYSLDSTILETSWVQNRLVFEDESFEDLVRKMERWYGVTFEFANEKVGRFRFTGKFEDESLEEALEAMRITADFSFTIGEKHVIITK